MLVFILIYMFLFWKIWFFQSKKKLIKNYDPEKDLGRLAEEEKNKGIDNGKKTKNRSDFIRREVEGRESESQPSTTNDVGPGEPKERELLPKTTVDNVRKNSSGIRKNSSGIRKLLGRRGRKRFG